MDKANMDDILSSLENQTKEQKQQEDKKSQIDVVTNSGDKIVSAVDRNTQLTAKELKNIKGEVKVINPDLAKTQDITNAVDAINKLNLTAFMQNEGLPKLAKNLEDLSGKTQELQDKFENEGLRKMSSQLGIVVKKLDEVSKTMSKAEISVDAKLQKTIDKLSSSINAIDFSPAVNVTAPQTEIVTTPVDFKPIIEGLKNIEQAIKDSESAEGHEDNLDLSPIISGLTDVQRAIQALRFPVSNYVLPFITNTGKATQAQLDASGNLPITGIVTTTSASLPSSLIAFRTTVTTAGTRVQLGSNALTVGVLLEAPSTNTGLIYIGGSNVSSTVFGGELQPGQTTSVAVNNTNLIYIDASVSGDKCAALGS